MDDDYDLQYEHNEQLIQDLHDLNAELLAALKAMQMEARARNCGLRIADEAIAKAEAMK
jgi:predicted DNA binding CopG/RHH family protein